MPERQILSSWKDIANYLQRGVRTVQRWEQNYRLPVRRVNEDKGSVFAYADEVDAWLARTKPTDELYLRPTFLVLDIITPTALSALKLSLESAKFNVLTAFSAAEMLRAAQRYDVDGFIIESAVIDMPPGEISSELKQRYPSKPRILVGEEHAEHFDASFVPGDPAAVVEHLIKLFGIPRVE